ncbi:YeiH family protein [Phaeobacter sp. 22II1-1F12B]|uniref:YeiH family protein n=1 Tax=Phaeobacter sp. 22II1-1F12B TaxID=1317111 RepID=UPI000B521040|nr:putative sulfate exporter family transporter [Phaeobacter sp. 22II1-1F12B]
MNTQTLDRLTGDEPKRLEAIAKAAGAIAPGLALALVIAAIATGVQRFTNIPGLSPLVVAMVLGMLWRNTLGAIPAVAPGITFSLKKLLRGAIILLGLQLTLTQLGEVGLRGFAIVATTLLGTFLFTKAMGRILGVERKLTELIAAGTSVCGASAVIATNTVTRGSDEDVAYAIACVTVFGSLSMLLFPVIGNGLQLSSESYGLWSGAAIHEVAQAVAAAFQGGEVAGQTGTVAKLSRVILLAPLILAIGLFMSRSGEGSTGRAPTPWFVFGFLAMVLLNSVVTLPGTLHDGLITLTGFLLTVALAAMGLETDIRKLRAKGVRPLMLGAAAWVFISITALGLTLALF